MTGSETQVTISGKPGQSYLANLFLLDKSILIDPHGIKNRDFAGFLKPGDFTPFRRPLS
jgi:hypothetical protein